jgi:uncharacterized protein (UPF0212 family)
MAIMATKQMYDDDDNEYTEENCALTECPKCGRDYDDADYDFQICHFCGWDADEEKYTSE